MDTFDPHKAEPIVAEKDLGLGIRFVAAVGNGRQVELTAGVPLHWDQDELDRLLDKLAHSMDRQAQKYRDRDNLEGLRLTLQKAENDLKTTREQIENHEAQARREWSDGKRLGPLKFNTRQEAERNNFMKNEQFLMSKIPEYRKAVEEAEKKCR